MRVAVRYVVDFPDDATFVQGFGDRLVGVPYVLALPLAFGVEAAIVDVLDQRGAFLLRQPVVFFAVSWSQVDNAGAFGNVKIRVIPDEMSFFAPVFKQWLVLFADKLRALYFGVYDGVFNRLVFLVGQHLI